MVITTNSRPMMMKKKGKKKSSCKMNVSKAKRRCGTKKTMKKGYKKRGK